jgi:hypothetical protein
MANESPLGGGESIATGEGVVIMCDPLGFPSFLGHVGKSMEVKGCGNGGREMVLGREGDQGSGGNAEKEVVRDEKVWQEGDNGSRVGGKSA